MKLYSSHGEDGWSIHQCSFGGTVQSVVMLAYTSDVPALLRRLGEAMKILGADLGDVDCIHASYLDVSIMGTLDLRSFGGRIPCRSIWGAFGNRLAAVLTLDIS